MNDLFQNLKAEFQDEDYRYAYAQSFLNTKLASQIKTLREQRGMTQAEAAAKMDIKQPGYRRFEDVNHEVWKTDSLWNIARTYGVRLDISFKTFGTLPGEKERLTKESLQLPMFEDDPAFKEPSPEPEYAVYGGPIDNFVWSDPTVFGAAYPNAYPAAYGPYLQAIPVTFATEPFKGSPVIYGPDNRPIPTALTRIPAHTTFTDAYRQADQALSSYVAGQIEALGVKSGGLASAEPRSVGQLRKKEPVTAPQNAKIIDIGDYLYGRSGKLTPTPISSEEKLNYGT